MDNQTPLIPFNHEAEKKVCGSLIIDNSIISDAMLRLRPEHFFTTPSKMMFEVICSLYINGHPITPDTISKSLEDKKVMDRTGLEIVGGATGIMESLEGVDSGEYEFWSEVVKRDYDKRRLLEFTNDARRLILDNPDDITKLRYKLEEKLVSLSDESHSSTVSISIASDELSERLDRYINNPDDIIGLPTGFHRLDQALDGLQLGNVSIVYAPSSRFKSLFTTNIGWRLAEQNIPGLWFTTEMPRLQVVERLLQLEAGVNLKWLRKERIVGEYRKRLESSQYRLSKYPIYFCDTSSLEVNEIRAEVNRHTRWSGIQYIIIDLVDHVSSSRFRDEMVNNMRATMAAMKQIAKDFNIHVLLVSHVSKGSYEDRSRADLDVESMIGSAAKYQDVDVSISIGPVKMDDTGSWVAMTREDILYGMSHGGEIAVMVSVTKNRHGELLRYTMELDFNTGGRFSEGVFKPVEKQAELTIKE